MKSATIPEYSRYVFYEDSRIINIKTNKLMHVHPDGKKNGGYLKVKLTRDDGKRIHWFVSRLIYTAFYGEIPKGLQIDHNDGNRIENSLGNICALTPKQNNVMKKQRDSNFLFNRKTTRQKKTICAKA